MVVEPLGSAVDQQRADPAGAEHGAFHAQVRHLVEGVDQPQVARELQAVDHHRRVGEADMLGPEVAMALDDAPGSDARRHDLRLSRQQRFEPGRNLRPPVAGRVEGLEIEYPAVLGEFVGEAGDMRTGIDHDRLQAPVETRQALGHLLDPPPSGRTGDNGGVEHQRLGQAAHHHQPVDRPPGAPDRQPAVGLYRQRADAEIDVGRQPAVEPHLLGTDAAPGVEGRVVEERITNRLLQLQRPLAGEEHPGHMGFAGLDLGDARISFRRCAGFSDAASHRLRWARRPRNLHSAGN